MIQKEIIIMLISIYFCPASSWSINYYTVDWNRTYICPPQNISEETMLISMFFAEDEGKGLGLDSERENSL